MVTYRNKAGFGIVEFNDPDSKVNVLSSANLEKLERILSRILSECPVITSLFFASLKKDIFIAGADIKEMADIKTKKDALALCEKGQDICNRIEQMPIPTFVIVDGACIGGGLELALSCDNILATDNKRIKIGFPEVKLEITPGFGGAHRLKEKIGAKKAKDLLRTGQLLSALDAKRAGIVDKIVSLASVKDYKKLSGYARRKKKNLSGSRHELDLKERETLAEKIIKKPARNALNAFLLAGKYKDRSLKNNGSANSIKRCAVIGAGTMGKGIAYLVSSETESTVNISDTNKAILKNAKTYIKSIYKEAVNRGIQHRGGADRMFKNISFSMANLENCDIVIECITEDMRSKKKLFAEIEREVSKDCVIATNTSCLSVNELGKSLVRPERFIGAHFFNPAYKMKLVEVAPASFTDKAIIDKVNAFLLNMRRVPVIVKDSPGFLVNRMLLPYLNEAVFMIEEGFSIRDIDSAMLDFGMPEGPVKLIDGIGSDVAYKAGKILEYSLNNRIRVPDMLKTWPDRKKILSRRVIKKENNPFIVKRILGPMKREAGLCLKEGIADCREVIDLVLLLGAGFPASKRIWDI